MTMLNVRGWIVHLMFFSAFVVSRTMSSFNPPLAYHTLHTYPLYGLSLIVKVFALAACSPPGSVCLYWISCYAQDEMAYRLKLILYTLDAVTCTPVTLFFPFGVQLCS